MQVAGRRLDLHSAITDFGGYAAVAEQLGWPTAQQRRLPYGYWRDVRTIQQHIDEVLQAQSWPARCMPSYGQLRSAGRYDLARAIGNAGGIQKVRNPIL